MSSLQEFLGALNPSRDRRFHTRTTLASLTYVELRDANGGLILNISEEGMALAVADVYEVGERLSRIRFPLPISSQSFEISAQIVWVSESKNGVGVRFVDLASDARSQLSRWIESEKPAFEFAQLLKPHRHESHAPEIANCRSRRIFTDTSACDEEAAARYAEIFPSEATYANHAATLDENQSQHPPLPIRTRSLADADVSILCPAAAGISTGDVPKDLASSFPSELAEHIPPEAILEAIEDPIPESNGNQTPELLMERSARKALETFSSESEQSFCRDQSSNPSPELLAHTESQGLQIVEPGIQEVSGPFLVEDPPREIHEHAPFPAFSLQVLRDEIGPPDPAAHSSLLFQLPEVLPEIKTAERGFGFHLVAAVCLFATAGIIVELAGGLGPIGKRFRHARNSTSPVDVKSPAPPDRTDGVASQTLAPLAANPVDKPAADPPAPQTDVVRTDASNSKSPSDPSKNAQPAHLASRAEPRGLTSTVTSPSNIDSANSLSTEKNADKADSLANLPSNNLNSSPAQPQPPTNPESSPAPNGSNGLLARSAPSLSKLEPEPPRPVIPVSPIPAQLTTPAPRSAAPIARPTPYRSRPPAILVTPPAEGRNPSKVTFPEKAISVSSSFVITSQLSVLIAPEPGPAAAHQPARLQAGELLFYAEPHFPKPKNGRASTETIKVRATIGQQGQVIDVKPVTGPPNLFPAAKKAIREWRYKPTLLNEKPIQFQQDVTIEFRPPQRPSRR